MSKFSACCTQFTARGKPESIPYPAAYYSVPNIIIMYHYIVPNIRALCLLYYH